ncbi:hypothetical protein DAPPUDRAFT_254463 [Daphnia pulex]|uniref:Uncharacterized protein n=1 Tax=Daphnia pulex TaxID=6669 RepID=E9H6X7_DAPPU|nr:hypothetical protein DAPPUDRAFT_254463 [Daphnia pulex]|eukprot:EFX72475.1 hypothetical protein DAPPUDRAFT_254463 [Daphnia pulex]
MAHYYYKAIGSRPHVAAKVDDFTLGEKEKGNTGLRAHSPQLSGRIQNYYSGQCYGQHN